MQENKLSGNYRSHGFTANFPVTVSTAAKLHCRHQT
jgi:hypothetical protein